MKFSDIKHFPECKYSVQIPLDYVDEWIEKHSNYPLVLEPDFQRVHVWTEDQQVRYLEYLLMGGISGLHIYFNCSTWMKSFSTPLVLVDGLQRLTAVQAFTGNRIKAFGCYLKEFEGYMPSVVNLTFNIANLRTKVDVLNWYLAINVGGTPHSREEIDRVTDMLNHTNPDEMV